MDHTHRRISRPSRRRAGGLCGVMALAALASTPPALAQSAAPLFSSNDELTLTLEAPFRTLVARKTRRPNLDGRVVFTAPDGTEQALDVTVTTRGFSRLEICTFPPLRLDFKRSQVKGTLFAEQNRIKLVTLCQRNSSYEQYLELEYLAYRMLNEVTEYSFRVRPVRVRYFDSERERDYAEAPAFFLEHIDGVAARTGMRAVDLPGVAPDKLDLPSFAIYSLFQFLIGNTDFSATTPADGEDCCHNSGILESTGESPRFVVVPYDFDQAGLIGTSYALPDPRLRIRTVMQRLYRGFCSTNDYLGASVALFNEARPRIDALFESEKLQEKSRERALEYLHSGYEVLNDQAEFEQEVIERCRG